MNSPALHNKVGELKVDSTHYSLFFHCSSHDSREIDEHVVRDRSGKKIYEIQLMVQNDGSQKHVLMNKYGKKAGSLLVKQQGGKMNLEIATMNGTKSGAYLPSIIRHSKSTIQIDGTTYNIIKSKLDGKKVYYVVAHGTDEPLVLMYNGFNAEKIKFFPKCSEALEKALLLVRSYVCFMYEIYNNN